MLSIDKLGNYIERLDRPNSNLRYGIDDVCGITNTKQLVLGTKANLIGRTFEKFSILSPKEFIFNRRTSRNGERISLGFNTTDRDWILTEDYCHFRIRKDKEDVLDPDYLYLFFLNPEFDRYARFNSWGSATEFFNWEEIIETPIPVPPIAEQRKIVHDYQVITDRIELLRKIDSNLFQTAKAYMTNLYEMDDVWQADITINEFCRNVASGGTPNRSENSYWENADIPWLKNGEIKNNIIVNTDEYISKVGMDNSSARLFSAYSVHMAMYCVSEIQVAMSCIPLTTNQAVLNFEFDDFREASFFYYLLATYGNEITSNANGSAQQNLSKELITAFEFKKPKIRREQFTYFEKNLDYRIAIAKELAAMKECVNLVLALF